jgi:hypothetical protein
LLALLGGSPWLLAAQPRELGEYEIKALFLLNFVQFVEWPADAAPPADAPFRIGVLGDNPFGDALPAAVAGEKIGGRPLAIVTADDPKALLNCQAVFVCRSERGTLRSALAAFANRPILTVGDMPEFVRSGGIVNFYRDGDKIRFEVNQRAARAAQLKLGSQILRLARIVEGDRK